MMDKYNNLITRIIISDDTHNDINNDINNKIIIHDDINNNFFIFKLIKLLKNRINNYSFTFKLIKLLEKKINKKYAFMDIYSDIISRITNPISFNKIYLIFNDEKLKENINEFDSYGWRILIFTIYHFLPFSFHVDKDIIYSELINLIHFLLINGADPNLTNYGVNGLNAIYFVLRNIHDIKVMEIILNMLVKYGAYIKVSDMEHILENKNLDVQEFVIKTYFT